MNLSFNVTLGDLMVVGTILVGIWKLGRRVWEHDIMWGSFAEQRGLSPTAPKAEFHRKP